MRLIFLSAFAAIIIPFVAGAQVVINEIGWAGTKASATDEWIELYNNSDAAVDLENWILRAKDGAPVINLNGSLGAGEFYLIERTAETTISDILGNYVGSFGKNGNLSNNGEDLELINAAGQIIDKVYFSSSWPGGGASPDYISMERVDPNQDGLDTNNWKSNNGVKINGKDAAGNPILGTPKQKNSVFNSVSPATSPASLDPTNNSTTQGLQYENVIPVLEKGIKVYAEEDKLGVAGADLDFTAKAWGLKDEPLDSARFIWNFGDGFSKEGRVVNHVYSFPGEYIAVLDVSSGEYSASDRINIKIIPNEVAISEVSPFDSWIELYNGSGEFINLSFWKLKNEKRYFVFPKNTIIKSKSYLVVPFEISLLKLDPEKGSVEFLYPNNSLADKFSFQGKIKETESFSSLNGETVLSVQTPSKENAAVKELSEAEKQTATLIQSGNIIDAQLKDIFKNEKAPADVKSESILSARNHDEAASSVATLSEETKTPPRFSENRNNESERKPDVLGSAAGSSTGYKWILAIFGVAIFSSAGFFIFLRSSRQKN